MTERARPWLIAAFVGAFLLGAGPWHARFSGQRPGVAHSPFESEASAAVLASPSPTVDRALEEMRMGLTELRQAAKTGDPLALREAERDILGPLLDGLAASRTEGALDAPSYSRVVAGVAEVQGLFREIPYLLVVKPGGTATEIRLPLRRSPIPAIEARGQSFGWRMAIDGDTVTLTP
jgi:hypothetical protein